MVNLNTFKKVCTAIFLGVIIYLIHFNYSLSDTCRNLEKVVTNDGYLPMVRQSIQKFLEHQSIKNEISLDVRVSTKSIRSLQILSPSSPKLELDWEALDIHEEHAILKVYKEVKLTEGKKIYSISEFGIGAGRNYLMFAVDKDSKESAYVECGVYDN